MSLDRIDRSFVGKTMVHARQMLLPYSSPHGSSIEKEKESQRHTNLALYTHPTSRRYEKRTGFAFEY